MDEFLKKYQEFCNSTSRHYETKDKEIMTWGLGISGEAGDVAGCIKKTCSQDNDQRAGIKENLGDTLWYIAMICNFYGWSLEDVFNGNIEKLRKRYPQGFNKEALARGNERIDWNEKK